MNIVHVTYKGKRIEVENGVLDLSFKNIGDLNEIKGLETLTNLQRLKLNRNALKGYEEYLIQSGFSAQKIVEYCTLNYLELTLLNKNM